MTEHPGDTEPGAEQPTATEAGPDATSGAQPDAQPDAAAQVEPGPGSDAEEPDALGHVEEQVRVPEEQSTVAQPGEALEELLPALASTGHDGVDDALATLDEMAEKSVHDHVDVFDAVHEELRRTLDQAADQ